MERLLTPPDPPLSSQGFRLRPFTDRDAGAVKAAGEDPDIVRYTVMPAAPTDETTAQWLTRAIDGWHHGLARLAIVPAYGRDDRCAGQIGLFLTDHPAGNAEAFYWLLPEARGLPGEPAHRGEGRVHTRGDPQGVPPNPSAGKGGRLVFSRLASD